MNKINQITSDPRQKQTVPLDDGTTFEISIYFMPMQYGWYIEELTYGEFSVRAIRITNNFNILHQFRNIIPFGLACLSKEEREPTQQEDFTSGASNLYVLNQTEVQEYGEYLSE